MAPWGLLQGSGFCEGCKGNLASNNPPPHSLLRLTRACSVSPSTLTSGSQSTHPLWSPLTRESAALRPHPTYTGWRITLTTICCAVRAAWTPLPLSTQDPYPNSRESSVKDAHPSTCIVLLLILPDTLAQPFCLSKWELAYSLEGPIRSFPFLALGGGRAAPVP